jgi:hypothetical protein
MYRPSQTTIGSDCGQRTHSATDTSFSKARGSSRFTAFLGRKSLTLGLLRLVSRSTSESLITITGFACIDHRPCHEWGLLLAPMKSNSGLGLVSWCRHGPHAAVIRNLNTASTEVVWTGRSKWENPASPLTEGEPVLVGETDLCHPREGCRLQAIGVVRKVRRQADWLRVEIDINPPTHPLGWTPVDGRFLITRV